jgi:hypothetical protein
LEVGVVFDINFHCDEASNFQNNIDVRAFTYKDYTINMHNHDFYEINVIISGKGIHCLADGKISVSVGDVFVIPPNTVHAYYNTNSLDVYHILLLENFITDNRNESSLVPGFFQLVEIEPFLRQHSSNDMFLHLNPSQLIQLKSDLYFIEDNSIYDTDEYLPLQKYTAWKILYWLSDLLFKQMYDKNKKTTHKYELEIVKTLEFIHSLGVRFVTVSGLICTGTAGVNHGEYDLSREELTEIVKQAKKFCNTHEMEIDFTSPGLIDEAVLESIGMNVPMCGAALSNMAVAPDGTVVPCQSWLGTDAGLGNILSDSFKKIWKHPFCKRLRKMNREEALSCPFRKAKEK